MTISIRQARLELQRVAGNGPRTISITQARQELARSVRNTPRPVLSPEARLAGQRRGIHIRRREIEAAKRGLTTAPGTARREKAVFGERRDAGGFTANQQWIIEGRRRMYQGPIETREIETR